MMCPTILKNPRANILGVGISIMSLEQAVESIERFIAIGGHHYVCLCNVHTVVTSRQNNEFRHIVNEADLALPDGMPLVWGARLLGYNQRERVDGPALMLALCERSLVKNYSHFFYGGRNGVPELLAEKLMARFSGLNVAGCYSPLFRPLTSKEDKQVVKMINDSGADILWVGLGAPKQERWIADHLRRVNTPVMLGVGAAFDFHCGTLKRAPRWMRKSGLEWLFRLTQEPRRLWRRYVVTNTIFLSTFFLQLTKLKKFPTL